DKKASYGVQFFAPRHLHSNSEQDGYEQETFEIKVLIDNSIDQAQDLNDLTVELGLPLELELAPGETRHKSIRLLRAGEVAQLTWQVRAIPQQFYRAARYWVSLQTP